MNKAELVAKVSVHSKLEKEQLDQEETLESQKKLSKYQLLRHQYSRLVRVLKN